MYWEKIPSKLYLPRNTIHIWLLNTDDFIQYLDFFQSYLCDEEISRANRYKFDRLRDQFTINRGYLRYLLCQYLQTDNDNINFDYNSKGKPFLSHQKTFSNFDFDLNFNLSHSKNYTVYALYDRQIGIDLETIKKEVKVEEITKRFFTESEFQDLCQLNESDKYSYFFQLWTAKEAYLKLTGEGLSGGLSSINLAKELNQSNWNIDFDPKRDDRFLVQIKTWQILPKFYTSIAIYEQENININFYQANLRSIP